jgi:hypothetical protein
MILTLAAAAQTPAPCPLRPQWRSWQPADDGRPYLVLSADTNGLEWNGTHVSDSDAQKYLRQTSYLRDHPIVLLDTTGMDCTMVLHVETMVEAAHLCVADNCTLDLSSTGEKREYHVRPPAPPPPPLRRSPGG